MVIVVTGATGIGKSTVCLKVVDMARSLGYSCGGILSHNIPDGGIAVEDVHTGQRLKLATVRATGGSGTCPYSISARGVALGCRAIDKGSRSDVLVLDEIGPLELSGEGFTEAIQMVSGGEVINCLMSVRRELLPSFLPLLHRPPLVFEVTAANRAALPEAIGLVLMPTLAVAGAAAAGRVA